MKAELHTRRWLVRLAIATIAVVAGFAVVHTGDLLGMARWYGATIVALALLALAGLVRRRAPGRRRPTRVVPPPDRPPATAPA